MSRYWRIKASCPDSLSVGKIPLRKKPALSIQKGSMFKPLAYFRDEKSMEEFLKFCVEAGWAEERNDD